MEEALGTAEKYMISKLGDKALPITETIMAQLNAEGLFDSPFGFRVRLLHAQALVFSSSPDRPFEFIWKLKDAAKEHEEWSVFAACSIEIAKLLEFGGEPKQAFQNMHEALAVIQQYQLDSLYPAFAVRYSSINRFYGIRDTAVYYAQEALRTAPKYGQLFEEAEANLLMGVMIDSENIDSAIVHFQRAANLYLRIGVYPSYVAMQSNLARSFLKKKQPFEALAHADTSINICLNFMNGDKYYLYSPYKFKGEAFEQMGQMDSAIFYLKKAHATEIQALQEVQKEKLVEVDRKYNFDKKNEEIAAERKQKGWLFLGITLTLLLLGLLAFFYLQLQKANALTKQQKEELKSLDKFKSRFFANVSHELRTPLTMVLGPLETLLASKTAESANEKYLLKLMRENSRKLLRMVNDILDLSKLESGKLEFKESPVNLQQFLKPILAQFGSYAESNGIQFEEDNKIPEGTNLLLDADKVETILYNYLSNAMKYTPKGGRVKVSVFEEDGHIRFEVSDSGLGIHEKDINHIFDRYYQSEHTNRSPEGGTGIGLSLVSQLSDLMGGTVGVKSTWGKGSTFFFSLPKKISVEKPNVLEEAPPPDLPKDQMEPVRLLPDRKSSKTVLIVEDNEALRNYLEKIIGEFYNTIKAENGQLAFEYLQKSLEADPTGKLLPDLILSDLMMPVMDGSQLLSRVKSDDLLCCLPFIMLTARVDAGAKLEALRVGVDDYLTKPFKEEELLARIRNLIKNYERRQVVEKQSKKTPKEISKKSIQVSAEDRSWLAKFEHYVQENLTSDMLTVPELANEFSMSESSLLRQLKRLTGMTPKQYLQEVRLDLARQLLENGQYKTVSEVAHKVGYSHTPSFTRGFKDRFGVNPSAMLPA